MAARYTRTVTLQVLVDYQTTIVDPDDVDDGTGILTLSQWEVV